MKMKKRFTLCVLVVLLLSICMTMFASAAETVTWRGTSDTVKDLVTINGTDITIDAKIDPILVGSSTADGQGWDHNVEGNKFSFTFNVDPKIAVATDKKWYMIFAFRNSNVSDGIWMPSSSSINMIVFSDGVQLNRMANGVRSTDNVYIKGTFNDKKDHHVTIQFDEATKVVKLQVDDKTAQMKVRLLRKTGGIQVSGMYSKSVFKDFKAETVGSESSTSSATVATSSTASTTSKSPTISATSSTDTQSAVSDTSASSTNTESTVSDTTTATQSAVSDTSTATQSTASDTSATLPTNRTDEPIEPGLSPVVLILIIAIAVIGLVAIIFIFFLVLQKKKG